MKTKCTGGFSVQQDCVFFTLRDKNSGMRMEMRFSKETFTDVLGGLHGPEFEVEIRGMENWGKKLEVDTLIFEVSSRDKEEANTIALQKCPKGWKPDNYYGSQNSFFYNEDKLFAKTTIRRWV